jgi:hypothetical protein
MVELNEDANRIDLIRAFHLQNSEIWDIKASPYDRRVFACSSLSIPQTVGEKEVSAVQIFKMADDLFKLDSEKPNSPRENDDSLISIATLSV